MKLKTLSSAKKRVKITGTGKYILDKTANSMRGQTICALADAAAMPTQGMIKTFRSELEEYVTTNTQAAKR